MVTSFRILLLNFDQVAHTFCAGGTHEATVLVLLYSMYAGRHEQKIRKMKKIQIVQQLGIFFKLCTS